MNERKIGVVGLGAMGLGMAKSLQRAGYSVHVFDLRHDVMQTFAAEGGVACNSPAELASACEVLISVVVNAAQTEAVLFGEYGAAAAMQPGSVFVMCSTVDPGWSMALEKRLAEKNILYLDAPISGGAARAAKGEITMMTSGHPEAYSQVGEALDAMAAKVYRLGASGRERQQGQDHQSTSGRGTHRGGRGSHGPRLASRRRPCGALRGHHAQCRQQLDV